MLSNSFFLFGARATGKTTLVNDILTAQRALVFDLLKPELEEEFALAPARFREQILARKKEIDWVVIDEVQRLPKILNIVHQLIESDKIKFAITGSSARKLRRGAANLLAGRAFVNYLFPLTSTEVGDEFDVDEVLTWGSLPKIWRLTSPTEKQQYLMSYVATFVREEIKAEQIVRSLDPFRRFLEVAAQCQAKIINFTNVGRDVGCDTKTAQNYYQILEDTMMGNFLEPFHTSIRKAIKLSPKFYFFDLGVQRALAKQLTMIPARGSSVYGELFEAFFILECMSLNSYLAKDYSFSYLRTKDDVEIDLIIQRPGARLALVEIKSSDHLNENSLRRFRTIAREFDKADLICACQENAPRLVEGIQVLPWRAALQTIFDL